MSPVPASDRNARAMERFAAHWGRSIMVATAINWAIVRRGFAPGPQRQWTVIRADLNRVPQAMGQFRDTNRRFGNTLDHAWFLAMGPDQRKVAERWADSLKTATRQMLDEYRDGDAPFCSTSRRR